MHNIPGFRDDFEDGGTFSFEYTTKNQYRFYTFRNPEEHKKEFWQAKNISGILNLVNEEFDLYKN